jgi:hypothetical protein
MTSPANQICVEQHHASCVFLKAVVRFDSGLQLVDDTAAVFTSPMGRVVLCRDHWPVHIELIRVIFVSQCTFNPK